MADSPNDSDSSNGVFQNQCGESCKNATRAIEENLPSVGEHASENQHLPSPTQVKESGKFQTPFFQAPNIDQLEKAGTDVNPLHKLHSNNCSWNEDALKTPRQQPMASSTSILVDSSAKKTKTNQKVLSPLAARRNDDFTTPPERGTIVGNKSLSMRLKETNTPSPEKRCVETDGVSTPVKKLKKTPQSGSGEPGMETDSHRSKLGLSKTFYKSPTNLQIQQRNAEIQKNKESESPNPPSTPQITTKMSVKYKTVNDSTSISPSAAANILDKSPTYLQMQGNEVDVRNADESLSERKTAFEKHSDFGDVIQTENCQTFPTKELEYNFSNELIDSPSNYPNIREMHLTSDEDAMLNFTSKKVDTIMHPTILNDSSFTRPNASGKQEDILPASGVSFEILQPDLPVKDNQLDVHDFALNDKTSCSNRRLASKSQNSIAEGFESCIEGKKIQNSTPVLAKETQSASNMANSSVETQISEPSHSSPLILNPHFPSSCHLPRWSNSAVTDNPRPGIEFNTSDKREQDYQNRSDSSIRTATPDGNLRSQSKELSALESRRIHRRSQSDVTVTTRNSSEVQALQNQTSSLIGSQSKETPTSRSLLDISKDVNRETCHVQPLVRILTPRSTSNTTSTSSNPPISSVTGRIEPFWRSMTETLSVSRSNPELHMHQNPNDSLQQIRHPRFFSGDTSRSRNQPEELNDTDPPFFNVFEGQASTSSFGQASTSRNQPDVMSNANPRHIDEPQRQASTSAAGGSSSNDQPETLSGFLNYLSRFSLSGEAGEGTRALLQSRYTSCLDEYAAPARLLLSSVLRKMLLYNGETEFFRRFVRFSDLTEQNVTELENQMLCLKLTSYLNNRIFNYVTDAILNHGIHGLTAETFTQMIYEKLIASVVGTLAFLLCVPRTRDFSAFIYCYSNFRSLRNEFLEESSDYNVDAIQDEASRNRVKALQKMIKCLMLQTLLAHKLLLMYIGENSDENSIEIYSLRLRAADEKYLRRN